LADINAQIKSDMSLCYAITHSALGIWANEIADRNLAVQLDLQGCEYCLPADSGRVQQVFWNLLKNAVKFTPSGGRVTLRSTNPDSFWFRLEIIDTGIGIAPEALPRIFDAFEQAATAGFGGLGLGLTISKAIVEQHRGRLFASSAGLNSGATYVVEFPNASAFALAPALD
jgi:signal transduction histidine kinase